MANLRLEFEVIDALDVLFWGSTRLVWGNPSSFSWGDPPKPVITYDFFFVPVYTKLSFVGAIEQFSRVVDFGRIPLDAAGVNEQFSRVVDFGRSFADAAGADEQFSRVVDYNRTLALQLLLWGEADVEWDSSAVDWATDAGRAGADDQFSRIIDFNRDFADAANVDDAQRVTVTTPNVDVVNATEQFSRDIDFTRILLDTTGVQDQFSAQLNDAILWETDRVLWETFECNW